MTHNWVLYIAAFAGAFAITLLTTPYAKKLSILFGAIDFPKDRGMHKKPMPRMGGIAIVLGFMITVIILSFFIKGIEIRKFTGLIIGSGIVAVLGMVDDVKNLRARFKLCVQIVAALVVIFSGIKIEAMFWPFPTYLESLSAPITLIWIIGVTNAVNLIDGLDGLAAGVSSIAALSIMVLCILTGSELAVVLTSALAGSCIGFLPQNFNPAKVFMGDTGSTFLGFVLAVTSVLGVFKSYAILAFIVSVLCLGLPVFDTLFAMARRVKNHKPIMTADRGHLHHRLIDHGFSQRQAVLILYAISLFGGVIAIMISIKDFRIIAIVIATVVVLSFIIYRFNHHFKEHSSDEK